MRARFWFGWSMLFIGWSLCGMLLSVGSESAGWAMADGLILAFHVGFAVYHGRDLREVAR